MPVDTPFRCGGRLTYRVENRGQRGIYGFPECSKCGRDCDRERLPDPPKPAAPKPAEWWRDCSRAAQQRRAVKRHHGAGAHEAYLEEFLPLVFGLIDAGARTGRIAEAVKRTKGRISQLKGDLTLRGECGEVPAIPLPVLVAVEVNGQLEPVRFSAYLSKEECPPSDGCWDVGCWAGF